MGTRAVERPKMVCSSGALPQAPKHTERMRIVPDNGSYGEAVQGVRAHRIRGRAQGESPAGTRCDGQRPPRTGVAGRGEKVGPVDEVRSDRSHRAPVSHPIGSSDVPSRAEPHHRSWRRERVEYGTKGRQHPGLPGAGVTGRSRPRVVKGHHRDEGTRDRGRRTRHG